MLLPTGVEASGVAGRLAEGVIGEGWFTLGLLYEGYCCCWGWEEGVVARRASRREETEGCF